MPRGNPKPQTVATEKYTKKVGIVAKTYKLKKTLADEFADACERAGTNQSAQMRLNDPPKMVHRSTVLVNIYMTTSIGSESTLWRKKLLHISLKLMHVMMLRK